MTVIPKPDRSIPPLPGHLDGLLREAKQGKLGALPGIPDVSGYIIGWCASYLLGDREHCLQRLEDVYTGLGGNRTFDIHGHPPVVRAPEPETPPEPVRYEISDAADPTTCSCGTEIWFVKTPSGKSMPVTEDGVSHFETCKDRSLYTNKSAKAERAAKAENKSMVAEKPSKVKRSNKKAPKPPAPQAQASLF